MTKIGMVRISTGSWYTVRLEDGSDVECRIKGKFRLQGKKLTNPVAVGDQVMIEREQTEEEDVAQIVEILERRNYVVRQSPRKKHHLHLMASNIDQAMLIMTIVEPNLKQGFIDRYLLMTEPHDIPAVIVLNKSDLWGEDEWDVYGALHSMYTDIGYDVLAVSSTDGVNTEAVLDLLKDKITLLSGQSGVGKSTLINAIQPQLNITTKPLSNHTGKGQHTTTFAEMHELDVGGFIIDTPGIKNLSFNNLELMDVAHNFREFFEYSSDCKFYDCLHRNEPKCAVKQAVEDGEISALRYENYLQILEEIEQQNYWERPEM